jgi:tRNA threonylcarbamoyladenosine biosynthesis protein TsaE
MPSRNIISHSPEETEAIAAALAKKLKGGERIELVSDLGGGKTTFTRGLVAEIGSPDSVASPTFTISKEYTGGEFHVYHFDFYRLGEAGIISDEIVEIMDDNKAIVVVEWGGVVHDVLPNDRLTVQITPVSENERGITLTCPESLAYLTEFTI